MKQEKSNTRAKMANERRNQSKRRQSNRSYIFYFLFAQSVQIISVYSFFYDELANSSLFTLRFTLMLKL